MGDSNGQVELSCPGCATTFHLRPRKAKMPRNPIPCPKCGTSIEMTQSQIEQLRDIVGKQTPAAQVLRTRGRGPQEDALDEMERLANELENTKPKTSSTLIGHPISIAEKEGFNRSSADHKTRESDKSLDETSEIKASELGERPKTSEIPKEEVERARASMLGRIKPSKRPMFSSFGSEADDIETAEEEREADIHNATTARPPGMPPLSAGPLSEIHEEKTPPKGKVPLSELLKKVRDKRNTEGIAIPPLGDGSLGQPESSSSHAVAHSTDEVFEDIVDDVVGGATERLAPVRETVAGAPSANPTADVGAPSSTGRTENSMLSRLKKIPRSGLREKPGMAGERRGSGYIRLPESEILDLLGDGNYRLRVEDIVYEPIGDDAIIGLIKAGKLKGKDEIAEADGDWRRLSKHPLYIEHHVPEPLPKPVEEPGKSTKQMFGAVKPKTSPVPPPVDTKSEEEPPPPIKKRTSSTSGEWVQTNLDSTLDNLPLVDQGPNTPVPESSADTEHAEAESAEARSQPAASPEAEARGEAPTENSGPDFEQAADDGEHRLDGPPSYPAITLPEQDEPVAAPTAPPKPARRSSLLPILAGLLIFGGILAGAGFLYTSGTFDSVIGSATVPATDTDTTASTTGAATSAGATEDPEPAEPPEPTREERIAAATAGGDWQTALPLLEEVWAESPTPDNAVALIDGRIAAGQFRSARMLIFDARKLEGADRAGLDERFRASLESQSSAEREVVEIDDDWTDLELFSNRPLNYRIVDADGSAWRFIPAQDDGIAPRAEIAFYQLCGIIECGFEVPRTVPARVSKETLEALAGDSVSLSKIEWNDEGLATGALREAVEETHVGYPIENTSAWRRWLDSGDDPAELDKPFIDSLASFDEDVQSKLSEQSAGATTGDVARQVANILSADFLVNNFARFATSTDRYGSTVRMADGRLISVTNSAAFHSRDSERVRGRFGWTSRFGSDFVESVRTLDREAVDPVLFPDASRSEEARLDLFWDQRDKMLKRVDSLVERRSRATVLPF